MSIEDLQCPWPEPWRQCSVRTDRASLLIAFWRMSRSTKGKSGVSGAVSRWRLQRRDMGRQARSFGRDVQVTHSCFLVSCATSVWRLQNGTPYVEGD